MFFPNIPIIAAEALDKLLNLPTILNNRGEIYGLNEKRTAGMKVAPLRKNRLNAKKDNSRL